jgi:ABC-2 type transport system permease protein
VVVLGLVGVAFGISDTAVTGDTDAIGQCIVGILAFTPAVWLLVALTTTVVGLAPRAVVLPWVVLGVCFVIGMFGQLLDLPAWIQDLSPFQHVPPYPAADLRALPLTLLVVVAAGLTGLGLAGFRRRDLG